MNILNPRNVIGGIVGSYEDSSNYESENSTISTFFKGVAEVAKDVSSLVTENIAGVDTNSESIKADKFPTSGSLNFKEAQAKQQQAQEDEKKKQKAAEQKKVFYQTLKEDQAKVAQDKINAQFEEDINDIAVNMSTEEKNRLLHYQSSYKDRSVYQKAELRKKLIEERKKEEQQKMSASMAQTQNGASAMQTAFEGGSGSQGGGQSNLSFQAAG